MKSVGEMLQRPGERSPGTEIGYVLHEFVDIHCHILPGLDEGPRTMEESRAMIELARKDGISGIVATPHIINGIYSNTREIIERTILDLKKSDNQVGIYTGAEIRIDRDLEARVESKELPLINNKNFILLELPAYVIPPLVELENIVKSFRNKGITCIFAHPEKNVPIMKELSIMERLVRCGAVFQMTAMSITDCTSHRSALRMIRKGYIHVVATDAHDTYKRPPIMSEAYDVISRKIGKETARRLFTCNPLRIIRGEKIE